MTTERQVLLGCPFCGGEPYEEQFPTLHVIGCKQCAYSLVANGIVSDSETETRGNGVVKFLAGGTTHQAHNRAKWNTRVMADRVKFVGLRLTKQP